MRLGLSDILLATCFAAAFAFAACSGEDGAGGLCTPGSEIFCRCRGGAAGTKACTSDGQSFEGCFGLDGPCEETLSSSSSSKGASSSSTGAGGGKKLLDPCDKGSECASQSCKLGYCTIDCASWTECHDEEAGIFGDCVQLDGVLQVCVPYCSSQQDCDQYGAPSKCAYLPAVDAFFVTVCADFPGIPPTPPDGTECEDDYHCHLGHAGLQRVCEQGQCLGGCHVDDDCPEGLTCSGGAPGVCG